jgi:DNA-binding XRE family transcriptional regulator
MIHSLDKEAKRLGVARQSIIKIWLAERLQKTAPI